MGSDVNRRKWNSAAVTAVYANRSAPVPPDASQSSPPPQAPHPITPLLPERLDGLHLAARKHRAV